MVHYPTASLQLAGQKSVVLSGVSVATALGVGWAGWMGPLSGFANAELLGMSMSTSVGVGLLASLIGVRLAIGMWEKAKKRWWNDWDRIARDLKIDLEVSILE
jgi:hypothetical protein